MQRKLWITMMILASAAALKSQVPVAQTGARQDPVAVNNREIEADYIVSSDDELAVDVVDVPEISGTFRVSPGGALTLPLVAGPIRAAGLTLEDLAKSIADRLRESGMVTNPHVTIEVKESRHHAIAIGGAVKKPQIYQLMGKMTILDALSQAEGLAEDAGTTAIITRGQIGTQLLDANQERPNGTRGTDYPRVTKIDLNRLQQGDSTLNLDLYPGDSLTVERAGTVYVVGAVNRAGGFVLKDDREQMTVLKALALAEDLKSTAIPKKAAIIRRSPESAQTQEIPVDISKILSHHAPDEPLAANDILFVPDSTAKKVLHRAGEAAAQAAALFGYRVP